MRSLLPLVAMLTAALLTLTLVGHEAHAQGTSGTLPDPISTRELMSYADRLRLSDQQRQAVSALHEEYKRDFRVLREGEIAQFLTDIRNAEAATRVPDRKTVEDIFKRMSALRRRIETVDSQLFDRMQELLTADQVARMSRVRLARERARFAAQRMMWIGGTPAVDLSELVMDLKLPDADLEAADALLSQYESSLTTQMGKLHTSTARMYLDMFDTMQQMGLDGTDLENDPDELARFQQGMQTVWTDLTKKTMDLAGQLNDLNRRTLSSLSATLPAESARRLRNQYFVKTYPESTFAFGDEALFESALRLRELTDDQRQAVIALRDSHRTTMDGIGNETVEVVERQRRDISPFEFNTEAFEALQKKIVDLQTRAAQARQSAVEAIQAALGPELAAKLPGLHHSSSKKGDMALLSATAPVNGEAAESDEPLDEEPLDAFNTWGGDQFLPSTITQRELSEYVAMLAADDEQRVVIESLHEQYSESFARLTQTEVKKLQTALQGLWQYDQNTGKSTPPTNEAIDEVYALRKQALQAVMTVDESFFDDVAVVALREEQAPRLERVKLARQRVVFNRAHYYSGIAWGGASGAAGIDLTRLIRPLRLSADDALAIDPALLDYEQQVTPAFQRRYEVAIETQRAQERWNAEAMAAQEQSSPMQQGLQYQQVMGAAQKKLREAGNAIAKLNRETAEALVAALPASAAGAFQSAFNRRAYPDVYNDAASAERTMRSALRLADLTDDQTRMINDLAAEFHPAYSGLCAQMIEATEGSQMPVGESFTSVDWNKWQERQEALSKLTFDRNELNARTVRRLRAILTESQIERLGGLPDPKPEDHNPWD
jgi:hypothetical protein